jgi:hypothetical protein
MSTSKKSLADRGLRWSQVYEQGQDLAVEMPELIADDLVQSLDNRCELFGG